MAAFRWQLACSTFLSVALSSGLTSMPVLGQDIGDTTVLDQIVLTAEEQVRQALGVSQITAEDLQKQPVVNDISEIVRKQPGVNLTGATATGQRGNQRQIDIRGMGPENTLVLIDGRPVASRNAVRMSRGGERDTRGDSGWVPAELIDRIEVIRGPAAARYGSGSAGGVVNIITKRPEVFTGSVGLHFNSPRWDKEGATQRATFLLGGPVGDRLGVRLQGGYAKTDADAWDINPVIIEDGEARRLAGREGVVNRDLGGLLTWDAAPGHEIDLEYNLSRQGNIYAGDTMFGPLNEDTTLEGRETNRMYRRTLSVAHRGEHELGDSVSYFQWEDTTNSRLCERLAGGVEGSIAPCVDTDDDGEDDAYAFRDIDLDNVTAKTEWHLPVSQGQRRGVVTLGAEYRGEFMTDPVSIGNALPPDLAGETGVDPDAADRDPDSSQTLIGLFAEANIEWNDRLTLTPGLRLDHSSDFGVHWSPSLNATYRFNDAWSMKAGVARAFKAPNLFQLNPNYVYLTRSFGCPVIDGVKVSGPCYVLGNPDLDAETSLNAEFGVAYAGMDDVNGSLTIFHNDYDNRISSGFVQYNDGATTDRLFRWENQGEAVISGLEGNLSAPLGQYLALNANFTTMIKSENKKTGDPLSLVPDYTINAALDWQATDRVTVTLSATRYGAIKTARFQPTNNDPIIDPEESDPYTLINLGAAWQVTDTARLSAGITNIQDRRILRTNTSDGTSTFNEAGRALYVSLNTSF